MKFFNKDGKVGAIIKIAKVIAIFLFLAAAFELVLGGVFYWRTANFIKSAQQTSGLIVELEKRESNDESGATYYPIYTFTDNSGVEHRITARNGTYPPAFEVGEKVTILYPPNDPKDAEINSFWSLWLWPIILGGMALVEIIFGLLAIYVVPLVGRLISGKQSEGQKIPIS